MQSEVVDLAEVRSRPDYISTVLEEVSTERLD